MRPPGAIARTVASGGVPATGAVPASVRTCQERAAFRPPRRASAAAGSASGWGGRVAAAGERRRERAPPPAERALPPVLMLQQPTFSRHPVYSSLPAASYAMPQLLLAMTPQAPVCS